MAGDDIELPLEVVELSILFITVGAVVEGLKFNKGLFSRPDA